MSSWGKVIFANSDARGTARLVLLALGEAADKAGLCSLPVADLARFCGIRVGQVQYDLGALLASGELLKVSAGKGGRGSCTVYQITVQPIAPFTRSKRVQSMKGVLTLRKGCNGVHPLASSTLSIARGCVLKAELPES